MKLRRMFHHRQESLSQLMTYLFASKSDLKLETWSWWLEGRML